MEWNGNSSIALMRTKAKEKIVQEKYEKSLLGMKWFRDLIRGCAYISFWEKLPKKS